MRAMHDTVSGDPRALRRVDRSLRSRVGERPAECECQGRRNACETYRSGARRARLAPTGSATCREAGPLAGFRHLELRFSSIEQAAFGSDGSGMYPLSPPANHRFHRVETSGDVASQRSAEQRFARERTFQI